MISSKSEDGQYIYVDYYFYGNNNIPAQGQTFYVANPYRINIDFNKHILMTERGFYIRKAGDTSTFNIILNDTYLEADGVNSKWAGHYSDRLKYALKMLYLMEQVYLMRRIPWLS